MLDHLSLGVSDFARARAFYDACLRPLGYARVYDLEDTSGYGPGAETPRFWIAVAEEGRRAGLAGAGTHIAFQAPNRPAVDAFHRAALAAGGRDNGGPGLRPQYHPDYYAAFVIDPDGHRLEAVCHRPA